MHRNADGALDDITHGVGQCGLHDLVREVGPVRCPMAEDGAEAMNRGILDFHPTHQRRIDIWESDPVAARPTKVCREWLPGGPDSTTLRRMHRLDRGTAVFAAGECA